MKNHYDKEDSYFEYLDNLMPADEKNKFENHLKNCPECRVKLEKIASDLKELKTLPGIEPAQNSWVEFVKKTRGAKKTPMPVFFRWAAAAAAICMCLICVLFFAKNIHTGKEVTLTTKDSLSYVVVIEGMETEKSVDILKSFKNGN